MKPERKILLIALAIGLLSWFVLTLTNYPYTPESSFWDALILQVPSRDLSTRVFVLVLELLVGAFMGNALAKRRKAEEAAGEASRRRQELEDIITRSPAVVFRCAAEGGWPIEFVSDNAWQLGYTPRDLYAARRCLAELIHPDDVQRVTAEAATRAAAGIDSYRQEYHLLTPAGAVLDVEAYTLARRNAHARISGYESILLDVSERKRTEEALRESRERYRTLFEYANDAIVLSAADDRIVEANDRACSMLGYARDELLALRLGDLQVEGAEAHDDVAVLPASDSHGERPFVASYARGDGTRILVEISTTHLTEGQERLALSIIRDITERRRLEDQLRQALKMEAIGRLAGGIAHDFNTLLTVISGYSQMLLSDLASEDPRRADCDEILHATQRAVTLTQQLLAFSRRQALETRVLRLNDVLQRMTTLLERVIGDNVTLQFDLASDLGNVRADVSQIERVVVNLAVNARDAMPEGGTLTITTTNVTLTAADAPQFTGLREGRYALLSVRDTGCGMPPGVLDHLFEPFFTTKELGKGTGLGLSTVYGIVKQSGGDIQVHSKLGRGSEFRIYLPATDAPPESSSSAAITALPHGAETILLVEDQEDVRKMTARMLTSLGYAVLEAAHAEAAIEVFGADPQAIDMVLTDIVMPDINGLALAQHLRDQRPDLPVLYASAYGEDALAQQGIARHGLPFIAKPFSKEHLAHKVRQVLDEPESGSTLAAPHADTEVAESSLC